MKRNILYFSIFYFFLNFTLISQPTIDQMLSVPFPSGMTASSDGNLIAWVFNNQGENNIFIATGQNFAQVSKLTNYAGDNGVGINSLSFTDDNQWLVYVRGNSKNKNGQAANPAQLQEDTQNALYVINIQKKISRKISEGDSPKISPDGKTVAFINSGQIWTASIQDSIVKPKMLFSSRGGQTSIKWNPDGSKIAFVSRRGDHSFIGIYDLIKKMVIYNDPSVDFDSEPNWNSKGTQIAYIREPNKKNVIPFTPQREGHPWSIRLMDIETGQSHEIWKADEGPGSVLFNSFPSGDLLRWANDNLLIFPWEKDGWVHLYIHEIDSKKTNVLTTGKGIVEDYTISKDGSRILYTTNIGDVYKRHVWSMNLKTRDAIVISPIENIQWNPLITSQGIALLHSSFKKPAWPGLLKNNEVMDIASNYFPSVDFSSLQTPEVVELTASDGMKSYGTLFYPSNYDPNVTHPAVIFLHGGSRRQMLQGFHYSNYYSNAYALNQYFASQGYVVLALNYRSGIGYGLDFREAEKYGVTGGSEVLDLFSAGEYLKNRKDVDGSKIGLWGGSYGGYLTAHGLARRGDLFAVGVDIHGVHNWNTELPTFAPWYDPLNFPKEAKLAYESSPEFYLDGWKNPVLLIHGDDDRNVPFGETVYLTEKLRDRGVYFEQIVFPDEVHSFLLHKNWVNAQKATFEFINRYLGEKNK